MIENFSSPAILANLIAAKNNFEAGSSVAKQVTQAQRANIMSFNLKKQGRDTHVKPLLDVADFDVAVTSSARLRDAQAARLEYGDTLLNAIPKDALIKYANYVTAIDGIDALAQSLEPFVPREKKNIMNSNEVHKFNSEVSIFLSMGSQFPDLYSQAEKAISTLARKLQSASTISQRRDNQDRSNTFTAHALKLRDQLQADRLVAVGELGPIDEKYAIQFIEDTASLCGIDPQTDNKKVMHAFMNALGFFIYNDGKTKEVWYHEDRPVAWLYELWMQEKIAIDVFNQSHEVDIVRAYFALSRVQEIQKDVAAIRDGIVATLHGEKASYPAKYRTQMGLKWFRSHKVCSFPIDEEKV